MEDMTDKLPKLFQEPTFRGGPRPAASFGAVVEAYGDYDVVLAEDASDILDALEGVDPMRRPNRTPELEAMVAWYKATFTDYAFVLACFNGNVNPRHPIVVEYVPHNDNMLFIPGLEGHDGNLPQLGQPTGRNFRCAFGAEDTTQEITVEYRDGDIGSNYWAPSNVTGFYDNRWDGINGDYLIPLESVREGLFGSDLFLDLVA